MNSNSRFEPLLSVPWSSNEDELSPAFEDYPPYSEVSTEQLRSIISPLHVRLDERNGIHILRETQAQSSSPLYIHHFDVKGNSSGSTPVDVEPSEQILDYAVDTRGDCYLLERIRRGPDSAIEHRVRKIAADGSPLWTHTEIFSSISGQYDQLLIDDVSLYLPITEAGCALVQIDPHNGKILNTYNCEKIGSKMFLRDGSIYSVVYFPLENRRALARFELSSGRTEYTVCDADLFGWLIYPLGVDRSANFYVFQDWIIGKIDFGGKLIGKCPINNIVVQPSTHNIYVSYLLRDQQVPPVPVVEVHRPDGNVSRREIKPVARETPIEDWKLIHVDEMNRLFMFGGEEPARPGILAIFSEAGDFEEEIHPPGDLSMESRLEPFLYWQVDTDGRVYLPITDQHGFRVVRLTF